MSDYIVIGAGLAGAATAWELASRGEDVTIVERSTPGNDAGSSHGSARIFRYAYPEALYTGLVVRARTRWDILEEESGRELITSTGAIDHGSERNAEEVVAAFEAEGVDHEVISAEAASARWPQFRFETEVIWHPDAGVLDSIGAVDAMIGLAIGSGRARLYENWTVSSVERRSSGGFRVRSENGEFVEGDKVVVSAGGWLPAMLRDLSLPGEFLRNFPRLQVRQEQAFHMPYRDTDEEGRPAIPWPTFIHKTPEILTYGLPGGRDAGFRGQKLAEFNGGPVIGSALEQDGRIRPEMRRKMISYAERCLPGLVPEPYAETTCLFTNTASEGFVIDEADGIVVVSACSGHGAKFAPLLGELAADLVTGAGAVPEEFRVASHGGR